MPFTLYRQYRCAMDEQGGCSGIVYEQKYLFNFLLDLPIPLPLIGFTYRIR